MKFSRRELLMTGLAAFAAGCADKTASMTDMPGPLWPEQSARPRTQGAFSFLPDMGETPVTPGPPVSPTPADVGGPLNAIPRSRWAKAGPVMSRINPMNGVNRLTVHHEGWHLVDFDDTATTATRLDLDRRSHLERLGAGDIGYHYIIDRAGRLWQGRDVRYQGAHVKQENEHNVGVMVLGNFDIQSPTRAQMSTLSDTLRKLMHYYKVPVGRVYTHQELNPTACPGKSLQPQMVSLRRGSKLA